MKRHTFRATVQACAMKAHCREVETASRRVCGEGRPEMRVSACRCGGNVYRRAAMSAAATFLLQTEYRRGYNR